jgi:hypothetical protein
MTTPQDSPRRKKQKIRRANQLAKWREKQAASGKTSAPRAAKPGKPAAADAKTEKKAPKK